MKRLVLTCALCLFGQLAHAQGTMTINAVGPAAAVNTAPLGTLVDTFSVVDATTLAVILPPITWHATNGNFYIDTVGHLRTRFASGLAPGPQAVTVTAGATGYNPATLQATIQITTPGPPPALQTMVITGSPAGNGEIAANAPEGTLVYTINVANPPAEISWALSNPNFAIQDTPSPGQFLLVTTWTTPLKGGIQTEVLTATAAGYNPATFAFSIDP